LAERPLVLVVLGTRPEAIKLFPVVQTLAADTRVRTRLAVTGQHREMVDQILGPFGIAPDDDLDIMRPDQSLNEIVCRVIPRIAELYARHKPALVVVQGDTTSAFAAGLAAFHERIGVAHVEAGLRSFNRFHPWPEEANRRMLSAVTDLHLAATPRSAENLVREGVPRAEILVTGNTVIDSLLATFGRADLRAEHQVRDVPLREGEALVLVTLHRRENWIAPAGWRGPSPLEQVLQAIASAARLFPQARFVYPVHRNPRVQEPVRRHLSGLSNVHLLDPLPYIPFVDLLARARVALTDSGGIQEEAPTLGVPVLVARETTERPEGVESGSNMLVGTEPDRILAELRRHLETPAARAGTPPFPNPFGDGRASGRVRDAVLFRLGLGTRPREFEPAAPAAAQQSAPPPGGAGLIGGRA
jgi:UDP-N-acetylglucosamine 2-epimerase (non-hydrolysing)